MPKQYEILGQVNTYNGGASGVLYNVRFTASTEYSEVQDYFVRDDQDAEEILTTALDNFDQYCIDNELYGD